jgi:hypothetical protein
MSVVIILALMTMGCSSSNSLQKTTRQDGIDVYFSKAEITKSYDVVASASGCCNCPLKKKQICNKFISRAKEKGVDAVLIEDVKLADAKTANGTNHKFNIKASYIKYKSYSATSL